MLPTEAVEAVLRRALQAGADFAEVYAERSLKRRMRVRSARLEEAISGLDYGAGIRLFFGPQVVYVYTNHLTREGLLEALETLLRARGALGRVDERGQGGLDFRKRTPQGLHAGANPITLDFSLQALGLWVEEGKAQYPLENFAVSGNLLELLQGVEGLGAELGWHPMGPSALGSPLVAVAELSFAGA
ncbi:hypothetical protein QT17_09045 [Thermus sp. 2.9]|uniref:metallopeptidase TldD-related protein n=1 Tax=Thermus sp. (strain 2.9) TaxID=1577051 RepID=UPI00054314C8|nr:hypothetical protein QT17_09045 [Thermus sp. 2.9]